MKKVLFILLFIVLAVDNLLLAASFENETLKYIISYKWGLIHKDAGDATLSLKSKGDNYTIMLTAKTKPWADRLYQVRDTLKGTIRKNDLRPLNYAKITHEKGEYKLDEINYTINGKITTGVAKRHRNSKGVLKVTEKTFSATGPVFDMLSVFYYLRSLDYDAMSNDKIYVATIFSGKEKETIKIRSLGIEKIKLKDKSERQAYHIRFNFTRDSGKKSSDDMDTWISTDSNHIPLYLTAKLPIGEVRAYFVNQ